LKPVIISRLFIAIPTHPPPAPPAAAGGEKKIMAPATAEGRKEKTMLTLFEGKDNDKSSKIELKLNCRGDFGV
jgi:hypothetical protein